MRFISATVSRMTLDRIRGISMIEKKGAKGPMNERGRRKISPIGGFHWFQEISASRHNLKPPNWGFHGIRDIDII
jgi:hypothetical protein